MLDKREGKGRGVYASQAMGKGQTVEVSPVLLLSKEEYARPGGAGETALKDYVFHWDQQGCMALAFGLGGSPSLSAPSDRITWLNFFCFGFLKARCSTIHGHRM